MYSQFDLFNLYSFYLQFQRKNVTRKMADLNRQRQRVESVKNMVSLESLNPLHCLLLAFKLCLPLRNSSCMVVEVSGKILSRVQSKIKRPRGSCSSQNACKVHVYRNLLLSTTLSPNYIK